MNIDETFKQIEYHQSEINRLYRELMKSISYIPDIRRIPIRDAARIMGCTTDTVRNRVKAGILQQEGRYILVESMKPKTVEQIDGMIKNKRRARKSTK